MTPIARRSFMLVLSVTAVSGAGAARAVDALPDARFVGFAQAVNDFGVASGNLALARSGNENVRGYATRAIAEHNEAASELAKSRQEAGVSYAPDGRMGPATQDALARLSSLQGPDFDAAFASAQLMVQTAAVDQYGAYTFHIAIDFIPATALRFWVLHPEEQLLPLIPPLDPES